VRINANKLASSISHRYPISALISKGQGVLPALTELHKADNGSSIMEDIQTLLKADPYLEKKALELFIQAADSTINSAQGNCLDYIAKGLRALTQAKASDQVCNLFIQYADSAIKSDQGYYLGEIAKGLCQLVQAKTSDQVCNLFIQYADSAIKSDHGYSVGEIVKGLSKLVQAKTSDQVCNLFTQAADSAINSGLGYRVGSIASRISQLIQAQADPEQVLNLIITILDPKQSSHEANQIDPTDFLENSLKAVINLELISPKIHKALINDLKQRRNSLLYSETIKICNDLDQDDIDKLKTFLENKKRIFADHQQFFLKVIAYHQLAKSLGLDILAENPELKSIDNKNDLSKYFAKQVLSKFAQSLNIDIDHNINYEEALKDWDLENWASLISTKDSWSEEDTKLFKLLIAAKLNNRTEDILALSKKSRVKLSKEMQAHNLNTEAWFNAHNLIPESSSLNAQASKSASELSREFETKFKAFNEFLNENIQGNNSEKWGKIKEHKVIEQVLQAKLPAENIKDFAKTMEELVTKEFAQGQVPEAIADLLNFIKNELVNYNPKDQAKKEFTIAIWDPMDIGHNLFAGNRAGSCTALGQNASAIFQFIIDPGTKYIYTKNSDGNITGYARVFLALDTDQKAKIFVDSVDGKAAARGDYQTMIPEVENKVIELAHAIGLDENDIVNRKTTLASKLGGVSAKGYYHHARFVDESSYRMAS
jgi:hypothetical protein